jgi:hypothetical protein
MNKSVFSQSPFAFSVLVILVQSERFIVSVVFKNVILDFKLINLTYIAAVLTAFTLFVAAILFYANSLFPSNLTNITLIPKDSFFLRNVLLAFRH